MGQKSVQEHRKINAEVLIAWHIQLKGYGRINFLALTYLLLNHEDISVLSEN